MPCVAPSEIIDSTNAASFGLLAEDFIARRYLAHVKRANFFPLNPNDMRDINYGVSNVAMFIAFVKSHNPGLSVTQMVVLSQTAGLVRVPDLMTDDALRKEFYEIKPNSIDGRFAGFAKVAALDALFASNGLPYRPGTTWNPNERHRVFAGSLFGRSIRADFHFFRLANGLIVYEICIDGDLIEDLAKLLLIVGAIIIIILGRGVLNRLPPGSVPAPAIA
jgi:hypothetical protein